MQETAPPLPRSGWIWTRNLLGIFFVSLHSTAPCDAAPFLPLMFLKLRPDVDTKNQVRQRSGSNESTAWTEGSVGGAGPRAWDGDLVAMTVCWGANDSAPIRLLYASSNETFEEYLWRKDDDTWHWQGSWPGYNGASGVTCYRSPGDYRYMGLINTQSELEFWYQEKANSSAEWQKCKVDGARL